MMRAPLQNHWQRHDWQSSPYAPKLRIVQALVRGKTASGAGFSRHDALMRCLGETAEIMALNQDERSDGMAAGPDFLFAAEHALAERLERWAVWDWWHGERLAQPVSAPELIAELRTAAVVSRDTSLWHIAGFPHINVMVAASHAPSGAQPILGFGAHSCAVKAAKSALIELGLMELNLRAPSVNVVSYFNRLEARSSELFPLPKTMINLKPMPTTEPLRTALEQANIKFKLQDRTPADGDLTVVKADIFGPPSWAGIHGPLL